MKWMLIGLAVAVLLFVVSGGHFLFLPLFFAIPLGGLFAHRSGRRW